MEIKVTMVVMLIVIAITSCGKKKECYTCTSPTAQVATQDDYDKGYTPGKKVGCVGESYLQGSSSQIHKKTKEECEGEIETWKGEGYTCEWD